MFLFCTFLLTFNIYISGTTAAAPCKITDGKCLENYLYTVADKIFSGDPSLSIPPNDPLFFDHIFGNLQILNYTLTDSNVTGLKRCKVKNIKVDVNVLSVRFDGECPPNTKVVGKYEVNGRFFSLPVEGRGDYDLIIGSFMINVETWLEKLESKNKIYLKIKNFKAKSEVTSPFKADIKNLFNGQKKLSDAFHKFIHENWKISIEFVQDPLLTIAMSKLFGNVNKLLKVTPFDK